MARGTALLRALEASLARHGVRGEPLVVGLSGGIDSTALVDGLMALAPRRRLTLHIRVIDHAWDAGSAARTAAAVAWATERGLEVRGVRLEPQSREGGREASARKGRWRALEEAATEVGARFIATAHTADDQAETLLLRLGRGAALRGAGSIREANGRRLRPLLACSRSEVLAHLSSRGLVAPVVDPSNADLSLARNRIRAEVLPALSRALGGPVVGALARFAALAQADERLLERRAARIGLPGEPNRCDEARFRRAPSPLRRRWLRAALERLDCPAGGETLLRLEGWLIGRRGGQMVVARRVEVVRRDGGITLQGCPPAKNREEGPTSR